MGGSRLLTTSLEYQYQVYPNWWAATFADSGLAADNYTAKSCVMAQALVCVGHRQLVRLNLILPHPFVIKITAKIFNFTSDLVQKFKVNL